MIVTCFSMRLNGWINYNRPRAATVKHLEHGRAIPFAPDMSSDFAYISKAHAERREPQYPGNAAEPREWVKNQQTGFYVD